MDIPKAGMKPATTVSSLFVPGTGMMVDMGVNAVGSVILKAVKYLIAHYYPLPLSDDRRTFSTITE